MEEGLLSWGLLCAEKDTEAQRVSAVAHQSHGYSRRNQDVTLSHLNPESITLIYSGGVPHSPQI